MILVSVYDKKACEFAPVFCVNNNVVAVRNFETTVKQGNNNLSDYPEDFSLVKVGEFNEGVVSGCEPITLCNAVDFLSADVKEKVLSKGL